MSIAFQLDEARRMVHGFRKYLDQHKNELSPEEYAGHRNYLKTIEPIVKSLELLQRTHLDDSRRFTNQERELLVAAIRQLRASLIPIATIKRGEAEEIILL